MPFRGCEKLKLYPFLYLKRLFKLVSRNGQTKFVLNLTFFHFYEFYDLARKENVGVFYHLGWKASLCWMGFSAHLKSLYKAYKWSEFPGFTASVGLPDPSESLVGTDYLEIQGSWPTFSSKNFLLILASLGGTFLLRSWYHFLTTCPLQQAWILEHRYLKWLTQNGLNRYFRTG